MRFITNFGELDRTFYSIWGVIMGTLDQPTGAVVQRNIAFVNVTGYTPTQIENVYNTNYGNKGWRIIQVLEVGTNRYVIAEKEL